MPTKLRLCLCSSPRRVDNDGASLRMFVEQGRTLSFRAVSITTRKQAGGGLMAVGERQATRHRRLAVAKLRRLLSRPAKARQSSACVTQSAGAQASSITAVQDTFSRTIWRRMQERKSFGGGCGQVRAGFDTSESVGVTSQRSRSQRGSGPVKSQRAAQVGRRNCATFAEED